MWMKLLLWAILLGSIIMGYLGYQTGSATNAAIGIGLFLITGFVLFFVLKLLLHFGFIVVKIILVGFLIGILVLGCLKGCQVLLSPSKPAQKQMVEEHPVQVQSFTPDSSQPSFIEKAKNFFSFSKENKNENIPVQNQRNYTPPAIKSALPKTLNGKVSEVRAGYLFKVDRHYVKLYGIDAPDLQQTCLDKHGAEYNCGQKSKMMLSRLISGQEVSCQIAGGDYKKNYIATCKLQNTDIGASMITAGWAIADRRATSVYIPYEEDAHRNKRGLWAGKFTAPWKIRNQQAQQEYREPQKQGFWESLF